jgi:hypothetical protein
LCEVYAGNVIDHIRGSYFTNVATLEFYKKRETVFVVAYIRAWIYIDWTDELGVQGQPGPKISLNSLSGMHERLKVGRYGVFGDLSRRSDLAGLSFAGNSGDNPQANSGASQYRSNASQKESRERDTILYKQFPEGFGLVVLVVFVACGVLTVAIVFGVSWWYGWLR